MFLQLESLARHHSQEGKFSNASVQSQYSCIHQTLTAAAINTTDFFRSTFKHDDNGDCNARTCATESVRGKEQSESLTLGIQQCLFRCEFRDYTRTIISVGVLRNETLIGMYIKRAVRWGKPRWLIRGGVETSEITWTYPCGVSNEIGINKGFDVWTER